LQFFPKHALVALMGAAGSGKSTIAKAFPPSARLELDALRAMASDSPGDQSATPVAVSVFRTLLDARLERRLLTVVDSTNSEPRVREYLLQRARTWGVPAIAIVARTPLEACLARQAQRPASKRVPHDVVVQQHAGVPSNKQLLADGWDQAHDAEHLDLLGLALARAAAAEADPLDGIRAAFGADLAAVFSFNGSDDSRGRFTIAGRGIALRYVRAEPDGQPWQARTDRTCACGGALWVTVTTPAELLAVYRNRPREDVVCERCGDEPSIDAG
jgi:predicted kinase